MKVLVCGKGGCGKSTVSALLAQELSRRGNGVLILDTDESNFGLHAQLGIDAPEDFMNYFGGKKVLFQKAKTLQHNWRMDDLPARYVSKKQNMKLMSMGKIRRFGEGCACPINALTSRFLEVIDLTESEFLIADTDAGIEHLGRGVDRGCDIILVVVDPSGESIKLSRKIEQMGRELNKDVYYVLNKVDAETEEVLLQALDEKRVITIIPHDRTLMTSCLRGEELDLEMSEIEKLADFLQQRRRQRKVG